MLFYSQEFIFVFLPIVLGGFLLIERHSRQWAMAWLLLASLLFYAYWNPHNLLVLLPSVAGNYLVGRHLIALRSSDCRRHANRVLAAGIAGNLALLIVFKYLAFLELAISGPLHLNWTPIQVALPLGISFFTFTQIAFLVDARRGGVRDADPVHYGLFVTYFPHLIAGPIMHHADVMPQFSKRAAGSNRIDDVAIGLAIFVIGLFKKVGLADAIGPNVAPVFDAARSGAIPLGGIDCWASVISYALQIYFDFSGYSDMAVGLSRMLGVRIPINFFSPYKAGSIIEFWRRWHMSLSTFLRDYLYFPLGGNRRGALRRHLNLMVVMTLGGLWHGANWTFVVWGALHGGYLLINHLWRATVARLNWRADLGLPWRAASVGLTFVAVLLAWVPFRAASFAAAARIWSAMLDPTKFAIPAKVLVLLGPVGQWLQSIGVRPGDPFPLTIVSSDALLPLLMGIVWLLPNSQQLFARFDPALVPAAFQGSRSRLAWYPNAGWIAGLAAAAAYAVFMGTTNSEFLYFQF